MDTSDRLIFLKRGMDLCDFKAGMPKPFGCSCTDLGVMRRCWRWNSHDWVAVTLNYVLATSLTSCSQEVGQSHPSQMTSLSEMHFRHFGHFVKMQGHHFNFRVVQSNHKLQGGPFCSHFGLTSLGSCGSQNKPEQVYKIVLICLLFRSTAIFILLALCTKRVTDWWRLFWAVVGERLFVVDW